MLIIGHREVRDILKGKEPEILQVVADAHRLYGEGVAGPSGSVCEGTVRAGAGIVLGSPADGSPEVFVEASIILAKRAGASAGLAAGLLRTEPEPRGLALVGLGPDNLEVLRFVKARFHSLIELTVFDPDEERAIVFARDARKIVPGAAVHYAETPEEAMAAHKLVSLAATATTPHPGPLAARPGTTVLDWAEPAAGARDFRAVSIGALLCDPGAVRPDPDRVTVCSPSGPAALDLALARWVADQARRWRIGVRIDDFLPVTLTAPAVPVTTSV
ncbi:2,3-diaminopropionate biosynthesis protein SbnB [Streptomyces sp. NPDC060028]|uniref:2,3-diaminopropionate biosynthesis protein SbnB n=1 Tax=Streptomyces sp. NPDC060028 TaxID=3347041 RepID=UPI0036A2D563